MFLKQLKFCVPMHATGTRHHKYIHIIGSTLCHPINKLNLLSLTDCLMIVITVALLQLNCGRAPFTMAYTFPFVHYIITSIILAGLSSNLLFQYGTT